MPAYALGAICLMKVLLAIFLFVLSLTAQTRKELDDKYGPIESNRYRVREGIAVDVVFSDNGSAKTFRIVSDNPKDKEALLSIDDVRKVIQELVPGRLCHRPLKFAEVAISCPQRRACQGFREEWTSATTLLVRYKEAVVYALVTLSDDVSPPPGNIKLLPDYSHRSGCGIDTRVGSIKRADGMEIRYDIDALAGNFASRYANTSSAEWTKTEFIGDHSVLIVLTKEKQIVATFGKARANFSARVSSQADIDDFLQMVLTYTPRK